jgi:glycosyltransferase involved in cell wall biosynthesis
MRTLFIEYSYLKGNSGGIYAARTHINLFAQLSEKLTLIYPYKSGMSPEGISVNNVELIPYEDNRSNISKFIHLCLGFVHRYYNIEDFFDKEKFDLVVFDNSVVSSRLINKAKQRGLKTITIHHNYQIEYLLADCDKLTLAPELFWTKIYEGQAVKYSDLNITLTPQDIDLLKNHYDESAKFEVLGVYESSFTHTHETNIAVKPLSNGHVYAITGGLSSKQTEDSLIRWINTYYPILKETDPLANVIIAGNKPSERLQKSANISGISLIPSPKDMSVILENADVYICPIDCGGGLKLRIMDGLKAGLPVISHSVSVRGYERMVEDQLIFSYNSKDEFRSNILKIVNYNFDKREIIEKYRNLYDFKVGVENLRQILKRNNFID